MATLTQTTSPTPSTHDNTEPPKAHTDANAWKAEQHRPRPAKQAPSPTRATSPKRPPRPPPPPTREATPSRGPAQNHTPREQAITSFTRAIRTAAANLILTTGQEWTQHVPQRLRRRLHAADPAKNTAREADNGNPPSPIVLHLYAGPDTPSALDYTIQTSAPWLSPFLVSIDILGDSTRHDLLLDEPYGILMRKAQRGELVAILGGHNCRTWTILLHMPQKDGTPGHPLRGRKAPNCWGLPDLTDDEQRKTDDDSTLLLRMRALYTMARECGRNPAFLLEHPADPNEYSKERTAHPCSSIWATDAIHAFRAQYGMLTTTFP